VGARTPSRTDGLTLRALLPEDARVICAETFRPNMSQQIEKGRWFLLTDAVVEQWPAFFRVAIPIESLDDVIER
jgi:hypothetical protein